ncbi:MAG TPA: selenide, water dikinase SelD [Spirochaetia bacterium]
MNLTAYSRFSGCGAKLGPGLLDRALCDLSQKEYPDLIADFRRSEDAGVLRLNDEQALVHTIDFFPPIVDDPLLYGRIAAANSLSDVYAMGGRPSTAVAVVGFPVESLDIDVLRKMMEGGLSALSDADCPLVGGHSIDDKELKFGYAVTGIVHPKNVWLNNALRGGERILLTKPIGTGLVTTALRGGMVSETALAAATASMAALNRKASEILRRHEVHACTDVTGFGLLGHACEMAAETACNLRIEAAAVPLLPSAAEYAAMGLVPEGTYRNKGFRLGFVTNPGSVDEDVINILFDPQTSGGLLAALPPSEAAAALEEMREDGIPAALIGAVVDGAGMIELA